MIVRYSRSSGIVEKNQGYVILGSGINTSNIFPAESNKTTKNFCFGLVSRMLWSKGVPEFVRAAEEIRQSFPETRFVMAGGASGGGAKGNPDAIP